MSEFDVKYNIVDEVTPPNVPLRGHYKKSFAYYTIRERLPIILTQVVDQLSRDKDLIAAELGDERVRDDIKDIQGNISKLKYELQTDKKLMELTGNETDKEQWNNFLATLTDDNNSYFTTTWLYSECYMYRRLKSLFEQSQFMKQFDCFRKQKENALTSSYETMIIVAEHLNDILANSGRTDEQLGEIFQKLLKLSLWGNRCDLSISAGKEIKQTGDPFEALNSLEPYILVDKSKDIWQCLKRAPHNNGDSGPLPTVDIIQDNSGYELFTDLLLANFLLEHDLAQKIRFHIKAIPWFISDVTPPDFDWTIQTLCSHENSTLAAFGLKLSEHLEAGKFHVCPVEYFWTGPYEFYRMDSVNHDLYEKLKQSHLLIFKGDLNYRKLLGDFNWSYNASFEQVLRGFKPTNLCSLRTIKADLVCELKEGVADELSKVDPMWMETGQYGVIHHSDLGQS